jgi:hypothetical protein
MLFTREDVEQLWCYFPSTRTWMDASHLSVADLVYRLPDARRVRVVFQDLHDASLAALAAHLELVLQERWRRQTSFFERLARDHPHELREGLDRLAFDLAAGRRPRGSGTATVLAWAKPTE